MCVQVNDIGLSMTCPALRERKWNKKEKEKKPDESTYCTHGWASAFHQVSRMKVETKFLIDPYTANTRLRAFHAQSRAAADEEGSGSTTIQLLSLIVVFEPIKVIHIVCSCCGWVLLFLFFVFLSCCVFQVETVRRYCTIVITIIQRQWLDYVPAERFQSRKSRDVSRVGDLNWMCVFTAQWIGDSFSLFSDYAIQRWIEQESNAAVAACVWEKIERKKNWKKTFWNVTLLDDHRLEEEEGACALRYDARFIHSWMFWELHSSGVESVERQMQDCESGAVNEWEKEITHNETRQWDGSTSQFQQRTDRFSLHWALSELLLYRSHHYSVLLLLPWPISISPLNLWESRAGRRVFNYILRDARAYISLHVRVIGGGNSSSSSFNSLNNNKSMVHAAYNNVPVK